MSEAGILLHAFYYLLTDNIPNISCKCHYCNGFYRCSHYLHLLHTFSATVSESFFEIVFKFWVSEKNKRCPISSTRCMFEFSGWFYVAVHYAGRCLLTGSEHRTATTDRAQSTACIRASCCSS